MKRIEINFKELFAPGIKKKWRAKPNRDWKLVFWSFLVVSLCVGFFHLYLFIYLLSNETFSKIGDTTAAPLRTLNQKELTKVMADFSKKSETTKKILEETPNLQDPGRG